MLIQKHRCRNSVRQHEYDTLDAIMRRLDGQKTTTKLELDDAGWQAVSDELLITYNIDRTFGAVHDKWTRTLCTVYGVPVHDLHLR